MHACIEICLRFPGASTRVELTSPCLLQLDDSWAVQPNLALLTRCFTAAAWELRCAMLVPHSFVSPGSLWHVKDHDQGSAHPKVTPTNPSDPNERAQCLGRSYIEQAIYSPQNIPRTPDLVPTSLLSASSKSYHLLIENANGAANGD
jgi:hypothetical protein